MNEHTPGPWYEASTGGHQGLVISEATTANVAVTYAKADADFIVRAVNAHDKMLTALKDIAENGYNEDDRSKARAAVASAEGRE